MTDAIKQLEQLMDRKKEQQHPNIPDYARVKSKATDTTANGLTKAILSWLELNGHWASRINTTGRYLQGQQYTDVLGHKKQLPGKWIPGTTRRGTADIHAVINGRHVSIEVKVGRDRMSELQHETQQAIEQSGGIYLIVRSFDDFMSHYRSLTSSDNGQLKI
jgi:hypothetical protein